MRTGGLAVALLLTALSVRAHATGAADVVPATGVPRAAIGRFDQAGFYLRSQCTVVLVAPDMVATAAHCVRGPVLRERPTPGHILLGYAQMHWGAHRREAKVLVPDRKRDLAFICLDAPVDVSPLPVAREAPVPGETLVAAGYGEPAAQRLTTHACRVAGNVAGERGLLDCPVTPGSSGGPVLRVAGGRTEVVGVLSRSSKAMSLFTRIDPQTVAAASCR